MKKKTVALLLACVMLIGVAMGGTLAWLMDATPDVVNTFTVGDIEISLAETTDSNYHYVPGATISKDPYVIVDTISEDCWVFVKIAENHNVVDGVTVLTYDIETGWDEVADGIYGRKILKENNTGEKIYILKDNEVNVSDAITEDMAEKIDGDATGENKPTLTLTAYAIQSDNISATTAAEAWAVYQAK